MVEIIEQFTRNSLALKSLLSATSMREENLKLNEQLGELKAQLSKEQDKHFGCTACGRDISAGPVRHRQTFGRKLCQFLGLRFHRLQRQLEAARALICQLQAQWSEPEPQTVGCADEMLLA